MPVIYLTMNDPTSSVRRCARSSSGLGAGPALVDRTSRWPDASTTGSRHRLTSAGGVRYLPPPMPDSSMTPVALLRAHSRHAPWNARGLAAHVTALVEDR